MPIFSCTTSRGPSSTPLARFVEKNRDALFPHVYDVLHASSDSLIQACFPEREEVQSKKEPSVANKYLRSSMAWSVLRHFARVDGVDTAAPRRRRRGREKETIAASTYPRTQPRSRRRCASPPPDS